MKWIKNGNQLINMAHVMAINITDFSETGRDLKDSSHIDFLDKSAVTMLTLKFDNLETAEAHLEAIAMFLENSHQSIMAMAPTNEEAL